MPGDLKHNSEVDSNSAEAAEQLLTGALLDSLSQRSVVKQQVNGEEHFFTTARLEVDPTNGSLIQVLPEQPGESAEVIAKFSGSKVGVRVISGDYTSSYTEPTTTKGVNVQLSLVIELDPAVFRNVNQAVLAGAGSHCKIVDATLSKSIGDQSKKNLEAVLRSFNEKFGYAGKN